jgi:hypothetical protein
MRAPGVCLAWLIGGLSTVLAQAQNEPLPPPLPFGLTITSGSFRSESYDNSLKSALLRRSDVREELSIDAEQRRRIDAISREASEAMRGATIPNRGNDPPTPEQMQQEIAAIRQRTELYQQTIAKGLDVLYAEQRGRLEQLFLQQLGAQALLRSDVADSIKMTHAQMDTLKALAAGRTELPAAVPGQPRDVRAEAAKRAEERKERQARFEREAELVLNEEQRAAWHRLRGEKFVFRNPPRVVAIPEVPPPPALPEDPER